jgi:Na+/melibiose symporter-like transporter
VILGVAFILGSFSTLFQPAERALTPEVVGNKQIANANALVQTSNSVIQAASNAAGGVLVVVVRVIAAFIVNTLTFVFSAALIVGVVGFAGSSMRQSGPVESRGPSMLEDIRDGFRYIIGFRELLFLTVSSGFGNLFFCMVTHFFVFYVGSCCTVAVTPTAISLPCSLSAWDGRPIFRPDLGRSGMPGNCG